MTTTTVSAHWTHHRFVQNLVNASRHRDLHEAAKEWRFSSLQASKDPLQCQLCNTRINKCVTLHNTANGNYLVLGENCYDKLLAFLRSGRVKSTLPSRDAQTQKLRRHWKGLLRRLKDRTVVGWFRDELQAGRLPDDIAAIAYTITRIGLAPTTEDADTVIAYYKATRRFTIEALLGRNSLNNFPHRGLLPTGITINSIERVEAILDRGRLLNTTRSQRRWEVYERDQFKIRFATSISTLTALRNKLQAASQAGTNRAAEAVATVEQQISELTTTDYAALDMRSLREAGWKIEVEARKMAHELEWHVKDPETILVVKQYRRQYVLAKRNNRWQRLTIANDSIFWRLPFGAKKYTAVVLEHQAWASIKLIEQAADGETLIVLNFTVPSKNVPGTYIAMQNGKVVLPSRPIRTPDAYKAFIMNDAGKYYRAWVL